MRHDWQSSTAPDLVTSTVLVTQTHTTQRRPPQLGGPSGPLADRGGWFSLQGLVQTFTPEYSPSTSVRTFKRTVKEEEAGGSGWDARKRKSEFLRRVSVTIPKGNSRVLDCMRHDGNLNLRLPQHQTRTGHY